jgi:hypothetical protein
MPAVNSFLRQALAILLAYHADPNPNPNRRWSAAYLPLSKLLGDAFNNRMRAVHELDHDYIYVGNFFPGQPNNKKEHVVPMKHLIHRLLIIAEPWQEEYPENIEANIAQLRQFLRRHIVMAHIPQALNQMLPAYGMPDDNWWCPTHAGFTEEHKEMSLWQRYRGLNDLQLVIPFHGNQDFVLADP